MDITSRMTVLAIRFAGFVCYTTTHVSRTSSSDIYQLQLQNILTKMVGPRERGLRNLLLQPFVLPPPPLLQTFVFCMDMATAFKLELLDSREEM
jgi:hypothetical protein